jgi:hypothetical protein
LLVAAALVSTGFAHAQIDPEPRRSTDRSALPDPQQARSAALGFESTLANYYWLDVLQLVGAREGSTERHAARIGAQVELVTSLDPWVGHPYRFAALWMTDSPESVRAANALLSRGLRYHPRDWRNPYYLGFNRFFYLEDNDAAAAALERAAELPGSPAYLSSLVARLRSRKGGIELAEQLVQRQLRETQDDYERAELGKALDELETERRARHLDDARARFFERNGRDIASVEDLVVGPQRVLRSLPKAHPIFDGFTWEISAETREIVSSYYRKRYELHLHPSDRARRDAWRARL